MSDTKILLLNGPPRCGKDTAANYIQKKLSVPKFKFATPLKDGVHKSLSLQIGTEYYENKKDEHLPEFFGLTPREAYIKHSEEYMKPTYGKNIFSRLFIRDLDYSLIKRTVVSDCGFQIEIDTIIKRYGLENVGLIHIHRDDCSFIGDSRSYIKPHSGMYFTSGPNDNLVDFLQEILTHAKEFFEID